MFKVLIPENISEVGKNYLLERGYELKVGVPTDVETLRREVADADALIVRNARYPREVLEAGKRLKVVARHGTGVDNIDLQAATELGIQVTNGPTANINAVAEYVVALVLAQACQIKAADMNCRSGNWKFRTQMPKTRRELKNSVVGIIGLGRVGSAVAEKLMNGFGVRVIAYNLVPPVIEHPLLTMAGSVDEVIADADIVTLHVPATPETKDMCDYAFFQKMKRGAYFINCARGDVCVEEDLVRALREGLLSGAALDVYRQEPISPDNELLTLDNIIFSPHNASMSKESADNMALHAAMGVDEVLTGKTPTWPVNRLK